VQPDLPKSLSLPPQKKATGRQILRSAEQDETKAGHSRVQRLMKGRTREPKTMWLGWQAKKGGRPVGNRTARENDAQVALSVSSDSRKPLSHRNMRQKTAAELFRYTRNLMRRFQASTSAANKSVR